MHPLGQEREPVHLHRAGEDDAAEHEADDDLEPEAAIRGGAGRLFGVGRRLDALLAGARRRLDDVVAGAAHRLDQVLVGRLAGDVRDRRLLRRQIDVRLEHAGRDAERLLDPAHAARAGHADDRQRLLRGHDPVAGSLHGRDQVAGRDRARVEGHGRLLRREVHGRLVDALHLADGALRPRHAAGAGHAGDREFYGGLLVAHGAPGGRSAADTLPAVKRWYRAAPPVAAGATRRRPRRPRFAAAAAARYDCRLHRSWEART